MSKRKMTKEELLEAISRLEKNPHDRARILGEIGIAGVGAVSGGAVAAALGTSAASIPIITALTGATVVVAAPVALVAGASVAGALATYGLVKLALNGAFHEGKRSEIKKRLLELLKEVEAKEKQDGLTAEDRNTFIIFLKEPLKAELITAEQTQIMMTMVENGQMPLHEAYEHLNTLMSEHPKSK